VLVGTLFLFFFAASSTYKRHLAMLTMAGVSAILAIVEANSGLVTAYICGIHSLSRWVNSYFLFNRDAISKL
jgi:hypothetical protein